ncbi:VOC family protein [Herbidospora cretacea]|uniref:VOC family protein n=1 Tax=Herbidospora cretacea TaxID=28444 RepID=UPI0004C3189C|nr:VOC family protein [Herbidospora cretacea]
MQFTASTISLTVDDVTATQEFFTAHLGYRLQQAAEGFASMTRPDAFDVVVLARGIEVLPPEQRDQRAGGVILAYTLDGGLREQEKRLRDAGVEITMPLRQEPWGECLFQVTDPNGVIVQFVEWVAPDPA